MSSFIRRGLAAALMLGALVVPGIAGQVISPAVASASTCHAEGPGYSDMPGSDPATACTPTPPPAPKPTPPPAPKPHPEPTPAPVPAPPVAPRHVPRHVPRPAPAPVVVAPPAAPVAPPVAAQPTQVAPIPAPAVHTIVDNAVPAAVSYRFPWLSTVVMLLLTAIAGIRLWLRSGHRWNGKVRRILAGPSHDLHHNLLLATAENAETTEEDAQPDGRLPWPLIVIGVLLLPLTLAAPAGIRLWLRTGHRWNPKVRRLIAGPNHDLHHHLILDAAERVEQDEKTPV